MKSKVLHIVCLDVPYPPDYGGAIDMYYRAKALHDLGFQLQLHCYEYGRGKHIELETIAENVYYYSRQKSILDAFNQRPFIVASRRSKELLNRLLKDEFPILMEGLHTTWLLEHKQIQNRITFVRTHNVEHHYYKALAQKVSLLKKIHFLRESKKLKRYQSILKYTSAVLTINEGDTSYFETFIEKVILLPAAFAPICKLKQTNTEDYTLFHGNLSVPENEVAAKWIIQQIWKGKSDLPPLILAGKNPSKSLLALAAENKVQVIANPNTKLLSTLLQRAHTHLLVTDQNTGVKIKLLNALQTCGHVLVNPAIVEGTKLFQISTVCESAEAFAQALKTKRNIPLTEEELMIRNQFLEENFDTLHNCEIFNQLIFY